jgi:hypothetical protein
MNMTCTMDSASRTLVDQFATVWVSSLEFRIAVFVIVLQCSFMIWAASVVREIMKTSTTVLCRLLVYDNAVSDGSCTRTARTAALPSDPHRRHKTGGGPPPGTPPGYQA